MTAYSMHLFAGAGGGMLADLIDGITPVAAVEIKPFPRRILAKRFPGIGIWDDVRTFRADNPECADAFAWFRANAGRLVIAGGFPCQDISARTQQTSRRLCRDTSPEQPCAANTARPESAPLETGRCRNAHPRRSAWGWRY